MGSPDWELKAHAESPTTNISGCPFTRKMVVHYDGPVVSVLNVELLHGIRSGDPGRPEESVGRDRAFRGLHHLVGHARD